MPVINPLIMDTPLISSLPSSQIRLYRRRWYILFVYCINCVVYSSSYILYISIPETTEEYYADAGITTSDLNRTLTLCLLLYIFF